MSKGLFITFEGPDGSGKSTQIEYAKEYLQSKGLSCIFTREPGGTPIGEKLRDIILDKENGEMSDMTEALLYAASRAQHVAEKIGPALEEGKTVICDRYVDSSVAYQGYGRQMGDDVKTINSYAVCGYMPDITFLMDLDPDVSRKRIRAEEQDRLEMERANFHRRVYRGYLDMAEKEPDRIIPVDATLSKEEISEVIRSKLAEALRERGL